MFGVLPQPLEVKEVGESWLAHLAGPALLAIAAIFAAGIAAYVASRNHKKQLDHDRELRDREHNLNTMDAAFEAMHDLIRKVTEWEGDIGFAEKERTKLEADVETAADEDDKAKIETSLNELGLALTKEGIEIMETEIGLTVLSMRLRLRLGTNHDIVSTYKGFRDAVKAQRECLEAGELRNRSVDELDQAKRLDAISSRAAEAFLSACEVWFVMSERR